MSKGCTSSFEKLSSLQVPSPPCTQMHTVSSAGWSLPLGNLSLVSKHSFIRLQHAWPSALDHRLQSPIVWFRQTEGHLDIFLLYDFWKSLQGTIDSTSLLWQSRVYTRLWSWQVCVWRLNRNMKVLADLESKKTLSAGVWVLVTQVLLNLFVIIVTNIILSFVQYLWWFTLSISPSCTSEYTTALEN